MSSVYDKLGMAALAVPFGVVPFMINKEKECHPGLQCEQPATDLPHTHEENREPLTPTSVMQVQVNNGTVVLSAAGMFSGMEKSPPRWRSLDSYDQIAK